MWRLPWILCGVLVIAVVTWFTVPLLARVKAPIKVGLLHSLTGPMAISELSMVDAEKLAIKEINAKGLLGRQVVAVVADGRSDPETFASEARRLIEVEKVSVIVGCCSSACRKSVRPIVERLDHLLIYPVAYEGMEDSPNIVYIGAAPNQQIVPTVKWSRDVLSAKSYYLVGSDTVFPHAVHAIVKDQLKALGATLAGEEFVHDGTSSIGETVRRALEAKPDVIITSFEGDAILPFYNKIRGEGNARGAGGGAPQSIPIISLTATEEELRQLPVKAMTNDYLACNYFQSLSRVENAEFIRRFKAEYGADRVTSDTIVSAHDSLLLWAQALRESETDDVVVIRETILRQSLDAPEGVISIDSTSRHTWRPFFIGKIQSDGQVDVVWSTAKPIRPVPFPLTRSRDDWESFLAGLRADWNGNWSPPTRVIDKGVH